MGACASAPAAAEYDPGPRSGRAVGPSSSRASKQSRTRNSRERSLSNSAGSGKTRQGSAAAGHTQGQPQKHKGESDGPDCRPRTPQEKARRFKYSELQAATSNFSPDLVLGKGSFGTVYQGIVEGGVDGSEGGRTPVAVKRMDPESFQGYDEWLMEVVLLGSLRHPNLVRLVGFCAEQGDALLAYELCPNGSLDKALFEGKGGSVMPWSQRVRVAQDAARGLSYLHKNNVIHRDFKPSNVLLAKDLSARLTDFGMAKAGPRGDETHISTRVMGTVGYLDPAYLETGRLTRRSDTYAFGVMLLELLTGRRSMGPTDPVTGESLSLTTWVLPMLGQGTPDIARLVDPRFGDRYSRTGAMRMAIIAIHCIQDDPYARPEMSTVSKELEAIDLRDM